MHPEDHWNIAVAMRHGDDELKRHVDAALGALIADGTVARALARYHVPYYSAVSGASGATPMGMPARLIRHGVADRGPEPRMQKDPDVKTRRIRGWRGFARRASWWSAWIRTTCRSRRLIPEPAGLDYEIAGLLAKQLGVRLRVYWAISAHDSYPSKLSAKGLCDVILGVMPDDRFAQRVLYSRPYYRGDVPTGRPGR